MFRDDGAPCTAILVVQVQLVQADVHRPSHLPFEEAEA